MSSTIPTATASINETLRRTSVREELSTDMKLSRSELQLETIVSRIDKKELDLQPDFQRGEIWDNRRRQRLIDTVLREWYVPAVHIVQDSEGNEVVLDGQQRLAAIRDFFSDGFKVDGHIEPHSDDIASLHGKTFSQLPDAVSRAVRRFILQVITLTAYEPQEPNELFFRLNQSYNLTPPEKRNALHGPARDRVKSLVTRLEDAELLTPATVGFSNGRLAYDDIIARTCVALERDDIGLHINNNVVEDFYRAGDFSAETIARVERSGLDLLAQIRNCEGRVRFNKGTLFSWLIYLDWAPVLSSSVPSNLLGRFESDRAESKRGDFEGSDDTRRRLLECVALYDDRASYRVTDVSSVLTRDLMLHVYSCQAFGTEPIREAGVLLEQIDRQPSVPVQALVGEFLATVRWGSDLRGVEA